VRAGTAPGAVRIKIGENWPVASSVIPADAGIQKFQAVTVTGWHFDAPQPGRGTIQVRAQEVRVMKEQALKSRVTLKLDDSVTSVIDRITRRLNESLPGNLRPLSSMDHGQKEPQGVILILTYSCFLIRCMVRCPES
jgi:hypothetical protein